LIYNALNFRYFM